MQSKSSLFLYRQYKGIMQEEDYQGGEDSMLWFRARTNCIRFGNQLHSGTPENCKLFEVESQNLENYVLECERLEAERAGAAETRMESSVQTLPILLWGIQGGAKEKSSLFDVEEEQKDN